MIDLSESIIAINKVPKELPEPPHVGTVWRWIQRGVRNIKLETAMIGGKRYTSREALQRFSDATTAAADGTSPATTSHYNGARGTARTPRQRQHAVDAELTRDGI